jgi:hypothetical protein
MTVTSSVRLKCELKKKKFLRREKMKLKCLFVLFMVGLMVSAVSAGVPDDTYAKVTTNWGGTNADWDDTGVWVDESKTVLSTKPNGTTEVKMGGLVNQQGDGGYGTITLNSEEEWGYLYSNRTRIMGKTTLSIVDGGSLIGPGWFRVGEKSAAGTSLINQTGGMLMLVAGGKDPTRLVLGDSQNATPDTYGVYKISGGTLTHNMGSATSSEGAIILGDRGGNGTFQVVGTGGTIDMGRLYVGGNVGAGTGRGAVGKMQFDLQSDGVSAVGISGTVVNLDAFGTASTSSLVVTLTGALADEEEVIVLIHNTGTSMVVGTFDTANGGSAVEGATVWLGGDLYKKLTYVYAADGDAIANDVALLVPEPATIALLGLGLLAIRRKK